jgi:hypothetical protein
MKRKMGNEREIRDPKKNSKRLKVIKVPCQKEGGLNSVFKEAETSLTLLNERRIKNSLQTIPQ